MSKDGQKNIRVRELLNAYEKQECLWNPKLKSYTIKNYRDAAYEEIIRDLKMPTLTPYDVKRKIKGIRTMYSRELRIIKKHEQQGIFYEPKLSWFNEANSFLKNISVTRKKSLSVRGKRLKNQDPCNGTFIENTSDSSAVELVEDEGVEEQSKYMLKDSATETDEIDCKTFVNEDISHAKDEISIDQSPKVQTFEEHIISEPPPPADSAQQHDEFDVFCRSVAAQLRAIPDSYSRSVAKLKIQQILFEAETGHYKNSSRITIPIVQQINNL